MAVGEKKVRQRVVGHEQIHPAVVIDVRCDHAPGLAGGLSDVGLFRNLGEGAVAVVVEQPARHGFVNPWDAVIALAGLAVAAEFVFGLVEIHEAADEQVKPTVVVVVEPDGARGPAGRGDTRFFSCVGKSSVAVIVVEDALTVLGQVNIREPVAVVVPDRHALAVAAACYPGRLRDIGERPVAVIPVKRVAERRLGVVEIAFSAVHEVDVEPAVVVVVEEGASGAGGLRQIHFRRAAVGVRPGNSAGGGWNDFKRRQRPGLSSSWRRHAQKRRAAECGP